MAGFIDISNHQPDIDIGRVPCDAVVVKASEGRGWRDPSMRRHAAAARAAGKPVGFYHFVSQGNTADAEAGNLLAATNGVRRDGDLLVLDWEPLGARPGRLDVGWAARWLQIVADETPNPVWVYMQLSTAQQPAWRRSAIATQYPLWLAHYPGPNRADGYTPLGARGHAGTPWRVAAWQFTDHGRLPGHDGTLDLNVLYAPWWHQAPSPAGDDPAPRVVERSWSA